jgi:hypothetical protein
MDYDVEAQIGGKLAMLGSRLIDSTARSMAQQFFDRFVSIISRMGEAAAATEPRPRKKPAKKTKPAQRKPRKKPARKSKAGAKKAAKKRR